jgi:hypothetical protein
MTLQLTASAKYDTESRNRLIMTLGNWWNIIADFKNIIRIALSNQLNSAIAMMPNYCACHSKHRIRPRHEDSVRQRDSIVARVADVNAENGQQVVIVVGPQVLAVVRGRRRPVRAP